MRKLLTLALLALTIAVADGQSVSQPGGTARRIIKAASLPATCTVGDVYFKTAATVGTYQCLTTNTWTVFGGGGGGGATIPSTTNLINGDGAGNGADSGIAVATVGLTSGTLGQFASTTSAQLATVISNETGTGLLVFGTSPSLTTPVLGVATATSLNKLTITAPATGSTLTVPDGTTLNTGAGGTLGSNAFTSTAYAPLASPTFTGTVTIANGGVFGTPTSMTATNVTGLPLTTGVTGLLPAANLVNSGVFTGDATTTFPALTIGNGAITAVKMVNAGVMTGDVTTTFPAVTVAKVNGSTPGGTCTTQFVRSLSSSAVPTCASIANADLPTLTYTPSIFGGANLIPDSSGNVFAEPFTVLSASAFFAYNIMAFADTSTADCMFTRWNVPINYTTGGTNFIVDWNTTATSGNAIWTVDYRDVSTATLAATTAQESLTVTTAASGTASARTQSTLAATAGNFSAGDIVQIKVCRNGAGADTIAATLAIHDIRFSYVGRP